MQRSTKGDPTTVEYWDERVRTAKNDKDMIFLDGRREAFWGRVRQQLAEWRGRQVLDVACGYGQFTGIFGPALYEGVDFSEEMMRLAKSRHPDFSFRRADVKGEQPSGSWDVVFEVNSLRSLGMTAEDFITKFRPYARVAVACLECDRFTIEQVY